MSNVNSFDFDKLPKLYEAAEKIEDMIKMIQSGAEKSVEAANATDAPKFVESANKQLEGTNAAIAQLKSWHEKTLELADAYKRRQEVLA